MAYFIEYDSEKVIAAKRIFSNSEDLDGLEILAITMLGDIVFWCNRVEKGWIENQRMGANSINYLIPKQAIDDRVDIISYLKTDDFEEKHIETLKFPVKALEENLGRLNFGECYAPRSFDFSDKFHGRPSDFFIVPICQFIFSVAIVSALKERLPENVLFEDLQGPITDERRRLYWLLNEAYPTIDPAQFTGNGSFTERGIQPDSRR